MSKGWEIKEGGKEGRGEGREEMTRQEHTLHICYHIGLTAFGAPSWSWRVVGGQEAVTPKCCTIAELLLPLMFMKASYEEASKLLDVGVGEGDRDGVSGSRAVTVSLASCATNIAKDSSSA